MASSIRVSVLVYLVWSFYLEWSFSHLLLLSVEIISFGGSRTYSSEYEDDKVRSENDSSYPHVGTSVAQSGNI